MGRQWLHAKRAVASMKKAQATGKIVREIMVAAKMGGADPDSNARLAAAVEKARKESVSRDVIERAIKKGAGIGDDKAGDGACGLRRLRSAQGPGHRGGLHR